MSRFQGFLEAIGMSTVLEGMGFVKVDEEADKAASLERIHGAMGPGEGYAFDPQRYRTSFNKGKSVELAGRLSPQQLRKLCTIYPIARACINLRSSQITQLDYRIISRTDAKKQAPEAISNFFRTGLGSGERFRHWIDKCLEDLMCLDAVTIEKQRQVNGKIVAYLPIDSATIRRVVTEAGFTPQPPDNAYEQIIRGEKIAEWTKEEMIYDMLNPKTHGPYGTAPMESLILVVTGALKADSYNLSFLTEGNVPEGLIFLDESISKDPAKLKQYQNWFDLFQAGDHKMMRRLKMMPKGNYVPTKKPEDMAFEEFQLWLLRNTCAMFGVMPDAIGFTMDVNRAQGQRNEKQGVDKGLLPLANFFKEIFDDILFEMGAGEWTWKWTSLDIRDRDIESKIAARMIPLGAMKIGEWREKEELEPVDIPLFMKTASGPVFFDDLINNGSTTVSGLDAQRGELEKWQKKALNDFNRGMVKREFQSDVLPKEIMIEIQNDLKRVDNKSDIKELFKRFLSLDGKKLMAKTDNDVIRVAEDLYSSLTQYQHERDTPSVVMVEQNREE